MVRRRAQVLEPLADALARVSETVRECARCGNIATQPLCDICQSGDRSRTELCVVQDVADLWAMERAAVFTGGYFVLGGTLSALDGVGPDELRIPRLVERVTEEGVQEIILALSATIDGQTTAHYIADQFAGVPVRVSSLAQGVPIGGELDYLDEGTITAALRARKDL